MTACPRTTRCRRNAEPVTLAEQIVAWLMWRQGDSVSRISGSFLRTPVATRRILHGADA